MPTPTMLDIGKSLSFGPFTGLGVALPMWLRLCLRVFLLNVGVCAGFAQQPASTPAAANVVSVLTDRGDATYHTHDPVTFNIVVAHDGSPVPQGSVDWWLSQDGVAPVQNGTAAIKDGHAIVRGELPVPGFLQCKVTFKAEKETIRGLGAAAVDPLHIKPSLPVPDDFDAFWVAKKLQLKTVPINAKLTPAPTAHLAIKIFDVQADSVGDQPMRGYYARR